MSEEEFIELAAGHALHALSIDDQIAFDAALLEHPEWERHLMAAIDTAAALADTIAPEAPPAGIREALLARIAEEASPDPVVAPAAPGGSAAPVAEAPLVARPSMSRRWLALAASVVLLAGVVTGGIIVGQQFDRPDSVIALEQIEQSPDARFAATPLDGGGEAVVHWSEAVGQTVLVVDGLASPGAGETFELWYVREAGAIPAGTFTTDSEGRGVALLTGRQHEGDVIAVTVEQTGGSPSGQPTTDPVLAIAT